MLSDSEEPISLHHHDTFKVDVKNTFELEQEIKKHLKIAYIDKSGKEITRERVYYPNLDGEYDGRSCDHYFTKLEATGEYIKFDFQYSVEDIIKENLPEFTCIGKVEWVMTE